MTVFQDNVFHGRFSQPTDLQSNKRSVTSRRQWIHCFIVKPSSFSLNLPWIQCDLCSWHWTHFDRLVQSSLTASEWHTSVFVHQNFILKSTVLQNISAHKDPHLYIRQLMPYDDEATKWRQYQDNISKGVKWPSIHYPWERWITRRWLMTVLHKSKTVYVLPNASRSPTFLLGEWSEWGCYTALPSA